MNILQFASTSLLTLIFSVWFILNINESNVYFWPALISSPFFIMFVIVLLSKTFSGITRVFLK